MLKGIWKGPGEDLEEAHGIRREVFVEEQKVDPSLEWDTLDAKADHLVIYDDQKPIATGRLRKGKNGVYTFERIAVRKPYRGQHIGEFLMKIMINEAFERGGLQGVVHAQVQAQGFYEKLGFSVEGERHMSAGIEHVHMIRSLI